MKLLYAILMVIVSFTIKAKDYPISYYEKKLEEVGEHEKPAIYNRLYWKYSTFNIDSAYVYAREGLKVSKKVKDKKEEVGLLLCLANYYSIKTELFYSLRYSEEALKLAKGLKNANDLVQLAYLSAGFANMHINPQKSFLYFQKAKKGKDDTWLRAKCDFAIGKLYENLGNEEKAKSYYYQSILAFDSVNNQESVNNTLYSLSEIMIKEHSFDSALVLLENLKVNTHEFGNIYDFVKARLLEWKILIEKQDFVAGLSLIDSLETAFQTTDLPNAVVEEILFSKITTFKYLGRHKKGLELLVPIAESAEKDSNKRLIVRSYESLKEIHSSLGNYETAARLGNDISTILSDSISNMRKKQLSKIRMLYDYVNERDSTRQVQEQERLYYMEETMQRESRQRNTYIILASTMILMFLIMAFYINNRKHNKKLGKANKELEEAYIQINSINEEIAAINNALEQKVTDRTLALQKRNDKLEAYATFNSHTLRAPVARLLGLIRLLKSIDNTSRDYSRILDHLYTSSEELDRITNNMQRLLDIEEEKNIK